MTLWLCVECTTAYSVGAQHCPACGGEEYVEEGTDMAKIGRHTGASNAITGEGMPVLKDKSKAEAPVEEVVAEVEESTVERDPDGPYAEWSLVDLKDEAEARGLAKSGTKAEIAARLEADDEPAEGAADE